ncbi:MAG TPA: FAD binding domain-containing protein [Nocardioidaceae bacterium]
MKPAPFSLVRPSTLDEALAALAADATAKVLAGGQSLVPLMSMRLAAPSTLVDINRLEDLAYVRSDEQGVTVGALARHAEVERDPGARRVQPLLGQAWRLVAPATIRNRGTTVGSIVHADSSAEMPVVLRLLGGTVTTASATGTRTIAADDLFLGPLETTLRGDEIATQAWFPSLGADQGVAFDEVARRHGDYALCGVAALVGADRHGVPTSVRTGYLSVCEVPTVVDLTGAFGTPAPTEDELDAGAALAVEQLEPVADIHATADYRGHLARVLTRRVVRRAFQDCTYRRTEGAE